MQTQTGTTTLQELVHRRELTAYTCSCFDCGRNHHHVTSIMADPKIQFPCGLRGYHKYRSVRAPTQEELLVAQQECNNPFDTYAIACIKLVTLVGISRQQVVEHLPKEISRFTRFIVEHRAAVTVEVVDIKHIKSPLVQGGLEILIEVVVVMPFSASNKQAIDEYKRLVDNHYEEPIEGKFDDSTSAILLAINDDSRSSPEELDTDTEDEETA